LIASEKRQGLMFLMVGPAGVGKNTLMQEAIAYSRGRLHQLPTATTRPARPNEQQGREHLFVSHTEFEQMIADDSLIEWQTVHEYLYGVPRATVETAIVAGEDLIADIEVLGATYLRSVYPDNVVLIFIQPRSVDDLINRMKERGTPEEEIATRLRRVEMELSYAPFCDYLIVNDQFKRAAQTLRGIIQAEMSRRALLNWRAENHLPRHKFSYATMVVPVCGDEMLSQREPPFFPTILPSHGEMPDEAALRILKQTFNVEPTQEHLIGSNSSGGFVSPVEVKHINQAHFEQITFVYQYQMHDRIAPPEGWEWVKRHS
jgi:guanylate kinase